MNWEPISTEMARKFDWTNTSISGSRQSNRGSVARRTKATRACSQNTSAHHQAKGLSWQSGRWTSKRCGVAVQTGANPTLPSRDRRQAAYAQSRSPQVCVLLVIPPESETGYSYSASPVALAAVLSGGYRREVTDREWALAAIFHHQQIVNGCCNLLLTAWRPEELV
jgi:hypothetical protein